MAETTKIPIARLKIPKHNARVSNAEKGLDDLKTSIKSVGLVEPVVVYENPKGQHWVLVGQRRLLAYHQLDEEFPGMGFDEIECVVRNFPEGSDLGALSLAENAMHVPMTRDDLAYAVTKLYDKCGSYREAAAKFGLSRYMIDKYVGLSRLPDGIKRAIREGEIHHRQASAERLALAAADALRLGQEEGVDEGKVLELARALAKRSELKRDMLNEAHRAPLDDLDDIVKRAERRRRISLNLHMSAELDSRLEVYRDERNHDNKEDAALEILAERLEGAGDDDV